VEDGEAPIFVAVPATALGAPSVGEGLWELEGEVVYDFVGEELLETEEDPEKLVHMVREGVALPVADEQRVGE